MDPNKVKMESINVIIAIVVFLIPITFTLTIPNTLEQSSNGKNASKELPFVEYFMEHNVSQSDAKKSFFDVGVKLLEGMTVFIHYYTNVESFSVQNYSTILKIRYYSTMYHSNR